MLLCEWVSESHIVISIYNLIHPFNGGLQGLMLMLLFQKRWSLKLKADSYMNENMSIYLTPAVSWIELAPKRCVCVHMERVVGAKKQRKKGNKIIHIQALACISLPFNLIFVMNFPCFPGSWKFSGIIETCHFHRTFEMSTIYVLKCSWIKLKCYSEQYACDSNWNWNWFLLK